jgi:hypothetical protein
MKVKWRIAVLGVMLVCVFGMTILYSMYLNAAREKVSYEEHMRALAEYADYIITHTMVADFDRYTETEAGSFLLTLLVILPEELWPNADMYQRALELRDIIEQSLLEIDEVR